MVTFQGRAVKLQECIQTQNPVRLLKVWRFLVQKKHQKSQPSLYDVMRNVWGGVFIFFLPEKNLFKQQKRVKVGFQVEFLVRDIGLTIISELGGLVVEYGRAGWPDS